MMYPTQFIFRCLLVLLLIFPVVPLFAAESESLVEDERLNGLETLGAFEEHSILAQTSTIKLMDEKGEVIALGTSVDKNLAVTKLSELPRKDEEREFRVRHPRGKEMEVESVFRDSKNDLAVLKLSGPALRNVELQDAGELVQGQWLVVGGGKEGIMIGVFSANRRDIKLQGGVIGVTLGGPAQGGVRIGRVMPESGAKEAGLQVGDIILSVNGIKVTDNEEASGAIKKNEAGTRVKLMVRRDGVEKEYEVLLGHRSTIFKQFNRNLMMSGVTSRRKTGYENVIQHDIPIPANQMGGPLMDLERRVIGINISRVNRSENFALPSAVLRKTIEAARKEFAHEEAQPPKVWHSERL